MSGVEKDGFTFWWKVENFSMLPHQKGEALFSPKFVVDEWKEIEWYLDLYPRGKNSKESDGYVSLFFGKTAKDVELEVTYALTFETTDSVFEILMEGKKATTSGWGRTQYISLEDFNAKKHIYAPQDILTMRFHLELPKKPSESEVQVDESEATSVDEPGPTSSVLKKACIFRSGIQIQEKSFFWAIKSISTCTDRIDTYFPDVKKGSPNLKVSLIFSEVKNSVCVPIEIRQTGLASFVNESQRLFVKCRITVVSNNAQFRDSEESTHLFKLDLEDVWHFPLFLKTNNLTRDKYLDADDTLKLKFDFAFSYKDAVFHWNDTNYNSWSFGFRNKPQESDWSRSLKNSFAAGDFSDITLKVGGKTFPSYKSVLSAHSSVFRAMFESDMKEKNSGVVEIEDTDPEVIGKMLEYIHSDKLDEDLSSEDAVDLYRVADKYDIVALKQRCSASIVSSLCVDNVCDILVLADTHKHGLLWAAACNFVRRHAAEILDTDRWKVFMVHKPAMASKIMYLVLTNKKSRPSPSMRS